MANESYFHYGQGFNIRVNLIMSLILALGISVFLKGQTLLSFKIGTAPILLALMLLFFVIVIAITKAITYTAGLRFCYHMAEKWQEDPKKVIHGLLKLQMLKQAGVAIITTWRAEDFKSYYRAMKENEEGEDVEIAPVILEEFKKADAA